MKLKVWNKLALVLVTIGLLTGFGFDDIVKKVPGNKADCSKSDNKKKCEKKQMRDTAKVVAAGVAAKMIVDMVISYRTQQTSAEDEVVKEYKLTHKNLPEEPEVVKFKSSIKPGQIVYAGKEVLVGSELVVVSGTKSNTTDIKQRIAIYDNEEKDKELISLTKPVNENTKKSGAFESEFKFTLPVGMPQGVYPIKTVALVNGKASKPAKNEMQLVLNIDESQQYQIVAMNP